MTINLIKVNFYLNIHIRQTANHVNEQFLVVMKTVCYYNNY